MMNFTFFSLDHIGRSIFRRGHCSPRRETKWAGLGLGYGQCWKRRKWKSSRHFRQSPPASFGEGQEDKYCCSRSGSQDDLGPGRNRRRSLKHRKEEWKCRQCVCPGEHHQTGRLRPWRWVKRTKRADRKDYANKLVWTMPHTVGDWDNKSGCLHFFACMATNVDLSLTLKCGCCCWFCDLFIACLYVSDFDVIEWTLQSGVSSTPPSPGLLAWGKNMLSQSTLLFI